MSSITTKGYSQGTSSRRRLVWSNRPRLYSLALAYLPLIEKFAKKRRGRHLQHAYKSFDGYTRSGRNVSPAQFFLSSRKRRSWVRPTRPHRYSNTAKK